jgi:hypothetical protein
LNYRVIFFFFEVKKLLCMALKINTGNIIILQRISGLTKTAGV